MMELNVIVMAALYDQLVYWPSASGKARDRGNLDSAEIPSGLCDIQASSVCFHVHFILRRRGKKILVSSL